MNRDDQSYLMDRTQPLAAKSEALYTFHYNDTGEEFGIGTLVEYESLKTLGYIDPASYTKAVA